MRKHVAPVVPVVPAPFPVVQPMADPFCIQDAGEPHRLVASIIPFAGAENDVHVVVFPRVRQVRQIFVRTVEINVVVVIAIEEITDLKGAAQADEMTDGIGMPESDVGGVIGAKTRTTNANPMGVAFAPGEIENVTHNHILIRDVSANAIGGMNGFVVETVEIN